MQGRRREQISVPLNAELRAYVEREAAREDRSIASIVRRLISAAARSSEAEAAR